jgi:hypothetical protein
LTQNPKSAKNPKNPNSPKISSKITKTLTRKSQRRENFSQKSPFWAGIFLDFWVFWVFRDFGSNFRIFGSSLGKIWDIWAKVLVIFGLGMGLWGLILVGISWDLDVPT